MPLCAPPRKGKKQWKIRIWIRRRHNDPCSPHADMPHTVHRATYWMEPFGCNVILMWASNSATAAPIRSAQKKQNYFFWSCVLDFWLGCESCCRVSSSLWLQAKRSFHSAHKNGASNKSQKNNRQLFVVFVPHVRLSAPLVHFEIVMCKIFRLLSFWSSLFFSWGYSSCLWGCVYNLHARISLWHSRFRRILELKR